MQNEWDEFVKEWNDVYPRLSAVLKVCDERLADASDRLDKIINTQKELLKLSKRVSEHLERENNR